METTNQQTNSIKFAALLTEGMNYVSAWTPTTINAGGCGIFARLLCEELEKLGIKHKIIAIFNDDDDGCMSALKDYLKNGNSLHKAGVAHAVVLINDELYVDSTGIVNMEIVSAKYQVEMSIKDMDALIEGGCWNPTFDHDCIPTIQKKLDEVFSHISDFHPGIFQYPKDGIRYTDHTIKYRKMALGPLAELYNALKS